jgi:5-carboxymethyl-2-hydroxymuconate isomerase
MPHLHLETTADLPENADVPDILNALVEALSKQETVHTDSVRAYHSLRSNWVMGDDAPPGFAHLTVSAFAGRSVEWRQAISSAMMGVLKDHFAMSLNAHEVLLTVEVREMEPSSYLREI